MLNEQQSKRAVEVLNEYLAAPAGADGKTPEERSKELDQNRVRVIKENLKPLLANYLAGTVALADFKSKVDSINKRNELWGFKGIKGQMFFNMVVNVADSAEECDQELKSALVVPANDQIASSRIKTFLSYIKRLGDQWVGGGNTRHGAPKPGSAPFFLSYFWQIQEREVWPVYYTNAVQTLTDLNIWQPSEDIAEDYVTFKHVQETLKQLFSDASSRPFSLYDVEHVFWFKGGNPYESDKVEQKEVEPSMTSSTMTSPSLADPNHLPDSYVPPIVAILPRMARHDPNLVEAAKLSGTSLERAFEKSIDAALTILGYDTKLLGRGKGASQTGAHWPMTRTMRFYGMQKCGQTHTAWVLTTVRFANTSQRRAAN